MQKNLASSPPQKLFTQSATKHYKITPSGPTYTEFMLHCIRYRLKAIGSSTGLLQWMRLPLSATRTTLQTVIFAVIWVRQSRESKLLILLPITSANNDRQCNWNNNFKCFCTTAKKWLTVSAAVRLMPRPPARVLSRNTKMSDRVWKSATMSLRSDIFDEPSNLMYVCFRCHRNSCGQKHCNNRNCRQLGSKTHTTDTLTNTRQPNRQRGPVAR